VANEKIYIHEFIDIIGHNRAAYMHHMAANWSPEAQEQRQQLCYGIWAVLGSTARWPAVVNIWEHDGWDGLAQSFGVEAVGKGAQDPTLEEWWAKAAELRSGGTDRILEPAPWTRTITELCAAGVRGQCYAHEQVVVRNGAADEFLQRVHDRGDALGARYGCELAGAWKTAMVDEDECILLWAVPTWQRWADFEKAQSTDGQLGAWRASVRDIVETWQRTVLVDAPLSPFRTGRQPSRSDRSDSPSS
jgi:hypothetical protein